LSLPSVIPRVIVTYDTARKIQDYSSNDGSLYDPVFTKRLKDQDESQI